MRKQNKKGFTIVELVIVIAVIAILVAVMVPTFVTLVRKAQISNDRQLVKNLNTALQTESQSDKAPKTMQAALDIAAEYGYDVAKINAKASDNEILWDSVNNVYCYFDKDGGIEYIPEAPKAKDAKDVDYWVISDTKSDKYSTYYTGTDATITTDKGFDAGTSGVTTVNYTTTADQTVTIRTNGDQCVLTITAANSDVNFYGFAQQVNVTKVKGSSLHIYGGVAELSVTEGHVAVEETGIVFTVSALDTTTSETKKAGSITNKGYIGAAAADEIKTAIETAEGSKKIGGDFEIGTLAQLEAFRDAVNAGNDFAGKTVKLTADIKLNDGWKPIGEGSRKVVDKNAPQDAKETSTFFAGTFDGQGHTISNLNNKGFVPTSKRIVNSAVFKYAQSQDTDNYATYAYGLFGLVAGTAQFKNLNLTNVDIDDARYSGAYMDSVGALVGFAYGGFTAEGITVTGTLIKGSDAVCGIVGRVSMGSGDVSIKNCSNSVKIDSVVVCAGIARIYDRASTSTKTVTFQNNTNTGEVTDHHSGKGYDDSMLIISNNIPLSDDSTQNTHMGNTATRFAVPGDTSEHKLGQAPQNSN